MTVTTNHLPIISHEQVPPSNKSPNSPMFAVGSPEEISLVAWNKELAKEHGLVMLAARFNPHHTLVSR